MTRDTETEVRRAIGPFHADIESIVSAAWRRWNALLDQDKAALSRFSRGRANVIWAFIADEASRTFDAIPAIEESDEEDQQRIQTVSFHLAQDDVRVVMRFKKMDPSGGTKNIETFRQYSLIGMLDVPEIPSDAIRITVGYVENGTANGAAQILVRNDDLDDAWIYEIPQSDDDVRGLQKHEAPAPVAPAARVRARQDKSATDKEAGVGSD